MNKITICLELPENPGRFQTEYIQAALDRCRDAGGGEVILSDGEWHIASLRMYSNTTLHLSAGTRLIASDDWRDYTDFHVPTTLGYLKSPFVVADWNLPDHYIVAPIVAFEAENVAVIGESGSLIDGSNCFDPAGEEHFRGPMGMVFCKCRGVTLRGYTFKDAANWAHQLDSCVHVHMDNVTVLAGHDGINIHHCVGVLIENSDFRTGDDCVAGYDAENVVVRNCGFNTSCNGFRFGGKNLLVENCRFWGPGEYPHLASGRRQTIYAIEYYAMRYDDCRVDSENWVFRNCTIDNVDAFIYYRYGNHWIHDARPLRDVTLENVKMTNIGMPSVLTPSAGNPLQFTMKNVSLTWRSGIPAEGIIKITPDIKLVLDNVYIEGLNA